MSLAERLQNKISRKVSGLFSKRPDGVLSSPLVQPPVPLASTSSGTRLDRTRTFSTMALLMVTVAVIAIAWRAMLLGMGGGEA